MLFCWVCDWLWGGEDALDRTCFSLSFASVAGRKNGRMNRGARESVGRHCREYIVCGVSSVGLLSTLCQALRYVGEGSSPIIPSPGGVLR